MLKKIGGLLKRHIILFIFCLLTFIVFVVMLVIFLKMTINTSGRYGNRLEGIEDVEISTDTLADISLGLEEKDEVSKAKLRIQGKIIYINISFVESVKLEKGKEIAEGVLSEFDEDELEFYDFSFVIEQISEDDEEETWVGVGSKNTIDSKVSWARS